MMLGSLGFAEAQQQQYLMMAIAEGEMDMDGSTGAKGSMVIEWGVAICFETKTWGMRATAVVGTSITLSKSECHELLTAP